MNISRTQVDLNNSAFEIYLSGCKGHCSGCYNPELWNFNIGMPWQKYFIHHNILKKLYETKHMIDKIVILGGEPFDQNLNELRSLLFVLKRKTLHELWVFTSYEHEELLNLYGNEPKFSLILNMINYMKYGKYVKELEVEDNIQFGYKLATSNQYIKCLSSS